jgi:hypothetical protein
MKQPPKPVVTVSHSLPGRLRARLSCSPERPDQLVASLREHPGMGEIMFAPPTGSLLIHFDPRVVTEEEIKLRVAFQLALDQGGRAVRLLATPEQNALQDSAVLSAIALATTMTMRWLNPRYKGPTRLDWAAGLGTAWSIVDHGWRELRERGYFDPEVLALAYLATALVRGNFLKASVVTWLTTFGRHLIEVPPIGVEVVPLEVPATDGQESRYEVVVSPDTQAPERLRIVGALQGVLKYAMTGGGVHGFRSLWEELRDVSRVHGEVLEGFGRMRDGIPIRFQ